MTTRAYCRCNSGHYFVGEFCPFDGWSSKASRELTAAVKKLTAKKQVVSLKALREAGVSTNTLARCIVVEFGLSASAFEAIAPDICVVDGEAHSLCELDASFK